MKNIPQDICTNKHKGNKNSIDANIVTLRNKSADRLTILKHLKLCGKKGATAWEISVATGIPYHTTSARCSELRFSNVVIALGGRKTPFGSRASVLILNLSK